MNPTYYLTFKLKFEAEKPKKLAKTSLNVKILECDSLHLCALSKETYFRTNVYGTASNTMKNFVGMPTWTTWTNLNLTIQAYINYSLDHM